MLLHQHTVLSCKKQRVLSSRRCQPFVPLNCAASVLPLQPIQLWYKVAQNVFSTGVHAGKAMEDAELVDGRGRIGEVASEDAQVDGSAFRVDHFHHMQNVVGAPAADRICRMRTVCGLCSGAPAWLWPMNADHGPPGIWLAQWLPEGIPRGSVLYSPPLPRTPQQGP